MKTKFYYSLKSLVQAVDRNAETFDVLSVDVFDTLLIRRVHEPDLVKPPVARFIANKAGENSIKISFQKALKIRNDIELEHRIRNGRIYPDREACYPDFMRETLDRIFHGKCPPGFLKEVTDFELAIEKSMLVPRSLFVELLERLHKAGKRIMALSDTYLPALYVRRLLEHSALTPWIDEVFSSADSFKAKASGAAYQMLISQYGVQPSKWLHIGDNPISDGLQPAANGIRAFVLRDTLEKKRKAVVRRYWLCAEKRRFWKGRLVQQLMLPLEGEVLPHEPLYITGYNFLSPLFCAFILHVAERTRELGIRRIYFFSREGLLFQQIWERMAGTLFPMDNTPDIRYLHVSRIALASTSCAYQGLTADNARIAFLPPRNRDFHDLCRVFDLSLDPLLSFLRRHGLSPDDPLSPLYPDHKQEIGFRFDDLLSDDEFQETIKQQTRASNRAMESYLAEQHFFDQSDVALIDIGWLGSIQRFLYESIKHREHRPRLHGFLFTATRGIEYPTRPDNFIEGWFYDRDRFDLAGSVITYALDMFEEACRAPYPGLMRYQMKNGRCELVFRSHQDEAGLEERRQNAFYAPLQQGILDGADRFIAAVLMLDCKAKELKPWLNYMAVSRLAFPRSNEVATMRWQYHLDDFNGSQSPPKKFCKPNLWNTPIGQLKFRPFLRTLFYLRHLAHLLRH